jgi:integrase
VHIRGYRGAVPTPKRYVATDGTVTWRVRFRVGSRATSETFDGRPAANAFCALVDELGGEAAVQHRAVTDTASTDYVPTVREMLTRHVAGLTGVEQRTRDDYLALASRTWLPVIGSYRVDLVNRQLVAHVVNQLDGTIAPKSIKNAHSLLSGVLQSAMYDGHLTANPARGTRLPRTGEQDVEEIRYLTYDEFDRLLAATPVEWRPFVVTLFGTGLRFSEATALQVQDVDLVHGTVRVMRAWKREKGVGMKIGPPKSRASRRTISLPQQVVEVLTPLLDRSGSSWLFTTSTDRVVQHSNFYNRIWKPACVEAKLDPRPRVHDARHTHASWLIAQGVRLETVQDRLGHESYLTTRKVYAHLQPAMRSDAGIAAAAAFASTSLGRPALQQLRGQS